MDLQSLPWYAQFLVFLLIGAIVFGIFFMLQYSDGQSRIKNLDTQIDLLETEIKKAEKKEAQLKQIEDEKLAKEKVLEKLKEILPEQKEISQILRRVQGLISTARLKIEKWKTNNDQPKEVYVEVPFSISIEGNYHNLAMFFDQLSKLKKIFTVNNLAIAPLSKMSSIYSIKATFIASTYTYQEKKAAPAKKASKRSSKPSPSSGGGDELGRI